LGHVAVIVCGIFREHLRHEFDVLFGEEVRYAWEFCVWHVSAAFRLVDVIKLFRKCYAPFLEMVFCEELFHQHVSFVGQPLGLPV
jgi:hypothetical protein